MKISGVLPLRNAVKLGYPFELAIRSLRPLCDEVVVLVDPTSEDDTLARVRALSPDVLVESPWDLTNHAGHVNCEISIQTARACAAASGDWIFSLQADEVLHENEAQDLRAACERAEREGVSALELLRLYFYGGLETYRQDWTLWMVRLFKKGHWQPDRDGAMRFDPAVPGARKWATTAGRIYHYSRVGDPQQIAERVRNLDRFFHAPGEVEAGPLPPYDFSTLRRLDTYVLGHAAETEPRDLLLRFDIGGHPQAALEYFGHAP